MRAFDAHGTQAETQIQISENELALDLSKFLGFRFGTESKREQKIELYFLLLILF